MGCCHMVNYFLVVFKDNVLKIESIFLISLLCSYLDYTLNINDFYTFGMEMFQITFILFHFLLILICRACNHNEGHR